MFRKSDKKRIKVDFINIKNKTRKKGKNSEKKVKKKKKTHKMTTTVPKIFAFPEFDGVAEAVADHIVHCQNMALSITGKETVQNESGTASITENNIITNTGNTATSNTPIHSNHNSNVDLQSRLSMLSLKDSGSGKSISSMDSHTNHHGNHNHGHTSSSHGHNGHHNKRKSSVSGASGRKSSSSVSAHKQHRFKIAISGGSLIEVLHQGLLKRIDIRWGLWDIYFVDERLVSFEDKQSNYGEAKRKIFDLIDIEKYGKPKIYHINEGLIDDPLECSDDYENCLIRGFASKDTVRLPTFNLILLGCAPDGHIASLFPNFQENLRENQSWCIPVAKAPSGPENRITMTIPVICHSQQISFVVEGAVKAPVIKTIIERPEKGLPSSIVNENAAGRVSWFVDEDALTDVMVTKKKYVFHT